jgi:hypothetical protein
VRLCSSDGATFQFALMSAFLLSGVVARPFLASIANNSDVVSRVSYVTVNLFGLLVALNVPRKELLNGVLLEVVTVLALAIVCYFAIIGTLSAQRIVKRLQHRLDFSIDLFAPYLDLPKHVARRVWQETLSVM